MTGIDEHYSEMSAVSRILMSKTKTRNRKKIVINQLNFSISNLVQRLIAVYKCVLFSSEKTPHSTSHLYFKTPKNNCEQLTHAPVILLWCLYVIAEGYKHYKFMFRSCNTNTVSEWVTAKIIALFLSCV